MKEHKDFYNDKHKKDGLGANCKECKSKQKANWKKDNRIFKEDFDINVFNENFIHKYTVSDLRNIAQKNNLNYTTKHTKSELVDIINRNIKHEPLEKFTKPQLIKMAKDKNIKVTHHYTKPEIIFLLNENE